MISNNTSGSASHAGYGNNQMASSNMQGKDPFETWGVHKDKNGASSTGGGLLASIFLHSQIQAYEEQLQFLNASKSDFAGTSVGESDTFFRFLSIRVGGVLMVSLFSLIFAIIVFVWVYIVSEPLIAYLSFVIILCHSFFPGYITYGMRRFVVKEFTTKFYSKIIGVWHGFEFTYLFSISFVFFLQTFNWGKLELYFKNYTFTSKIAEKFIQHHLHNISFNKMPEILEQLSLAMLMTLIIYIISMYMVNKRAVCESVENLFAHDKEQLRPAQLARRKAGKL